MYPTSEESRKPLQSKRIRKLFLSSFIVCCSRKAKKLLSKNPSQTLPVVSSSEEETRAGHLINTCSEFEPTENSRLTNEWNLEAPYSRPRLLLDKQHDSFASKLPRSPCHKRKHCYETNSWSTEKNLFTLVCNVNIQAISQSSYTYISF